MLGLMQLTDGTMMPCLCPPEVAVRAGDLCILETDRAPEYGKLIKLEPLPPQGRAPSVRLVRRATLQDQARAAENALMTKLAVEACARALSRHHLRVHLVRVRYSFDRTVLTILYAADDEVDVKPLARELGQELGARVDMRSVGVRDEAGMLGGMGICGRPLCCCTWLRRFAAVNVRMAKAQRLSLNPASINGHCGRLKCCLRYEYPQYLTAAGPGAPAGGSAASSGREGDKTPDVAGSGDETDEAPAWPEEER